MTLSKDNLIKLVEHNEKDIKHEINENSLDIAILINNYYLKQMLTLSGYHYNPNEKNEFSLISCSQANIRANHSRNHTVSTVFVDSSKKKNEDYEVEKGKTQS